MSLDKQASSMQQRSLVQQQTALFNPRSDHCVKFISYLLCVPKFVVALKLKKILSIATNPGNSCITGKLNYSSCHIFNLEQTHYNNNMCYKTHRYDKVTPD